MTFSKILSYCLIAQIVTIATDSGVVFEGRKMELCTSDAGDVLDRYGDCDVACMSTYFNPRLNECGLRFELEEEDDGEV